MDGFKNKDLVSDGRQCYITNGTIRTIENHDRWELECFFEVQSRLSYFIDIDNLQKINPNDFIITIGQLGLRGTVCKADDFPETHFYLHVPGTEDDWRKNGGWCLIAFDMVENAQTLSFIRYILKRQLDEDI